MDQDPAAPSDEVLGLTGSIAEASPAGASRKFSRHKGRRTMGRGER
jgi:hypothetical protein